MTAIRLVAFSGEIPRTIPRLLPDAAAQAAFDTRLENGDLRPIRQARSVFGSPALPESAPSTIYRFQGSWLYWPGLVHAAPGPVTEDRLYYTGDGTPKMLTGGFEYEMAIPKPEVALTATSDEAGSGDIETRLYVYTNVSQFGEESEPSPLSNEVDYRPGDTITLSGFSDDMGDRTATVQRIYRSQTSASGDTTLYLIAERPAGTGDFVDNVPPDRLQEPLRTLEWHQPPASLRGLISLPNGMMAAFSGKDLYFCEPYIPSAWPQRYILTTDYEIVALGAYGTTIVVMTKGNPYIVQGTSPEFMVMEKLELNLPCINAAGVVDLGYAIAYPSHDGLVVASSGGARVATESLFTRTGWLRLNPTTMVAGQYDGRYLASYRYSDRQGITHEGTIIIDLTGQMPFLVRGSDRAISFHHDITTGELFFLQDQIIYEWDAVGRPGKTQNWKSKEFVLGKPESMGAIFIETESALTPDEEAAIEEEREQIIENNEVLFAGLSLGGELNGAALNEYAINDDILEIPPEVDRGFVSVSVYADKKLVATVDERNQMARLPAGFLARIWEVEVTSNVTVTQVQMARTGIELKQV